MIKIGKTIKKILEGVGIYFLSISNDNSVALVVFKKIPTEGDSITVGNMKAIFKSNK